MDKYFDAFLYLANWGTHLSAARSFAEKRRREEARKATQEKTRREREAAIAREKYLDSIANRTVELWEQVEQFIATRQSKNYDLAIQYLVDLRDLTERQGTESDEDRVDQPTGGFESRRVLGLYCPHAGELTERLCQAIRLFINEPSKTAFVCAFRK